MREGKLTPVADGAGAAKRSITYHDPCYIGRHNGVYSPPRELLQVLPGAEFVEMPRNSEKSFCCGAGGARMWMEENIGERINDNRTTEAVATGADQIAVGCPFCRVMLSDGLTAEQAKGEAREEVEVLDVAQMLLASVKGEMATRPRTGRQAPAAYGDCTEGAAGGDQARARAGDRRGRTGREALGRVVLFDTPADDAAEEPDKPEPAKPAVIRRLAVRPRWRRPRRREQDAEPEPSGGSLFDLGGDDAPPRASRTRRRSSLSRPPQPRPARGTHRRPRRPAAPCSTSVDDDAVAESQDGRRAGRACRDHRSRGTRAEPTRRPRVGRLAVRHRGARGRGRSGRARARAGARSRRPRRRRPSEEPAARGEAEAGRLRRGAPAEDRRRHQRVAARSSTSEDNGQRPSTSSLGSP